MKRFLAVLLAALLLCGITTALAWETDSYVMTYGAINDQQLYYGTWQQAYLQILNNHNSGIHVYQNRTLSYYNNNNYVQVPCKPVALTDITGDGIPELLFLEIVSRQDGNLRGDLYIYSSDGNAAKCVLFVPAITRPGYDDVGLGFNIYQSSANGGRLVMEYFEYEWPWLVETAPGTDGRYGLKGYLTAAFDNSGEGNDTYLWNGNTITWEEYLSRLQAIQNGRTVTISDYYADDYSFYGLMLDYETTVSMLNGFTQPTGQTNLPTVPDSQNNQGGQTTYNNEIWGLTIDKLATRKGPGTQYDGGGTYSVKNQYIKILARAWDKRNGIWWVKCEIPYHGEIRVLWTGWKRFDHSTVNLEEIPEEVW